MVTFPIDVRVNNRQALTGNRQVESSLTSLGRTADATSGIMRRVFTGALIVGSVTSFTRLISNSVSSFTDLQSSVRVTEQLITTTGGAAGKSAAEIERLTRSIADQTLASSQEVRAGLNQLLSFTSISGDVFDRTARLAADAGEIFGGYSQSIQQFSKALEDPARQLGRLRITGITISKQDEDRIKALQEQGDLLGAQSLLLDKIEGQLGGAGTAAATGTIAGAVDRLDESTTEFRESLGELVVEMTSFDSVLNSLADTISSITSILRLGAGSIDPGAAPQTQFSQAQALFAEERRNYESVLRETIAGGPDTPLADLDATLREIIDYARDGLDSPLQNRREEANRTLEIFSEAERAMARFDNATARLERYSEELNNRDLIFPVGRTDPGVNPGALQSAGSFTTLQDPDPFLNAFTEQARVAQNRINADRSGGNATDPFAVARRNIAFREAFEEVNRNDPNSPSALERIEKRLDFQESLVGLTREEAGIQREIFSLTQSLGDEATPSVVASIEQRVRARHEEESAIEQTREAQERLNDAIREGAKSVTSTLVEAFNDASDKTLSTMDRIREGFKDLIDEIGQRLLESAITEGISTLLGAPSGDGGFFSRVFEGFNTGGSFTVGGREGVDTNLVAFRATRGERVDITPAGQSGGSRSTPNVNITNVFNIEGDADADKINRALDARRPEFAQNAVDAVSYAQSNDPIRVGG